MMMNDAVTGTGPLPCGQCRWSLKEDNGSRIRPRRYPNPAENHLLPTGALLLTNCPRDGGLLTLCRTQAALPVESSEKQNTLCFDESVQVISSESDRDSERVLSALEPYLRRERHSLHGSDECIACSDSSHGHGTVERMTEPSDILSSSFVSSFIESPLSLLSISLIRMHEGSDDKMSSPLAQACMKRLLVGYHVVFIENSITSQISIPFQGQSVCFRVASVLPNTANQSSRTQKPILYIIMPSTRITIVDFPTEGRASSKIHVKSSRHDESNVSPAAQLLIDTIQCARIPKVNIPRAFLLTGPPGVGKTYSVRLAVEASRRQGPTQFLSLQGSELLSASNHPAEAAKALNQHFQKIVWFCELENHVGIVFIDECEALLSSDSVAAMFGSLLDKVSCSTHNGWKQIVIVVATNRIDAVPAWLRRPGRLDREIALGPPDAATRLDILMQLLKTTAIQPSECPNPLNEEDLRSVAESCVGYVPADLAALVRRAALLAFQEDTRQVTIEFLIRAMADVGASALRDAALSSPPTTTWDDIAGDAGGAKTALRRAIEWPRTKKHAYKSLGLVPPRGILLHGPPGCAKTTLARAAAGASGIAFFSLSPADVYASSYVGDAEAIVRRAFTLARSAAPCILFFDEIDSVLGCASGSSHGMGRSAKSAEARVLSTFLNEMDGVDALRDDGVLVLGATNRPSTLDAALLRPGRFDSIIYVPPPDEDGRRALLEMQCRGWKCSTVKMEERVDVSFIDVDSLSSDTVTGSMTGAEILGACREAAMRALKETLAGDEPRSNPQMKQAYLEEALAIVKPLLSNKEILEEYTTFEAKRAGVS